MQKDKVLLLCGERVYSYVVALESEVHSNRVFEIPNLFSDAKNLKSTMNSLLNRLSEFSKVVIVLEESFLSYSEIIDYLHWLVPSEKGLYISYGPVPTNLPSFLPESSVVRFTPSDNSDALLKAFFGHHNGPIKIL